MKKLTLWTFLLCFLFVGQACNDLLDKAEPSTQIDPTVALSDPGSVEAVRASMYDYFHGFTFATRNMLAPDALADNSYVRDGATRFDALNFNYGTNAENAGLNDGSYNTIYEIILIANSIIDGIEEGVLEEDVAQQYRAEALVVRAYAMHYLVKALGYEPGMSPDGFDLGIIIRTDVVSTPADVQELPRNTVEEVYTQIKADLNEAITLFPGQGSINYMNQAFAQGLLARVHLFERDYENADIMAGNAINTSGLSLVSSEAAVSGMFDETAYGHPESIMTIVTDPSTESLGTNDALNTYTANMWLAQLPTQSLLDLYEGDDFRLGWFAPCYDESINAEKPGCTNANDEGVEIQKWAGELGQYADNYPLMRIAELKLIQAEARYQTDGVTAGLGPLNELREARGLDAIDAGDFQLTAQQQNVNPGLDTFIAEVLSERRRELAFEGHRFLDLKRLGLNIPDADGEVKMNYQNSHKILDDISPAEIETNEELEQNPGY